MKTINDFINEKLKLNKQSKVINDIYNIGQCAEKYGLEFENDFDESIVEFPWDKDAEEKFDEWIKRRNVFNEKNFKVFWGDIQQTKKYYVIYLNNEYNIHGIEQNKLVGKAIKVNKTPPNDQIIGNYIATINKGEVHLFQFVGLYTVGRNGNAIHRFYCTMIRNN